MDQKERMLAELPYIGSDEVLSRERLECKRRIYELNNVHPDQYNRIPGLLKELFGKTGEAIFVEPPFHCDYGYNIEVGENFFANYNCTVLDVAKVKVGNNVVIGGGSVVTRDIPDGVVAAGNPCRVIREITEEDRKYYAKKVCSFCMWSCVIVGVVMTALFLVFMDQILTLVGASPDTMGPAKTYLTIVSLGGVFVIISNCYSNIIRAEGQAGKAMMGQLIGNLLNVVLDPIMILVFDWGVAGAAVATVIGNLFGAVYYILYFLRGNSVLSIHPKDFAVKDRICSGVLAIGIPASLGSLLMSVSQIVVNSQLVNYGDMAVAGMGVAMKVTMITGMLCIGMGQGVQPLLGYCVGAGVWDRFKKVFRFSVLFALAIGVIMTLLCYLFTGSIVQVFLENPEAYDYGVQFARILLSTSALFGVFYVLCNTLQAMGAATAALIVNLSRQGIIYIPAVFIMQASLGIIGLAWAQPVADLLSLLLVAVLYVYTIRRMESKTKARAVEASFLWN